MFASFLRYHIHCPIFSPRIKADSASTLMWWEIVGCERFSRDSRSEAHIPISFPMEHCPRMESRRRIALRCGSAIARSLVESMSCEMTGIGEV